MSKKKKKRAKTNIVDDLIEKKNKKPAISLPSRGFQYYGLLFEKVLYSALFT